jgi:glycosyltransferase involved in cell wall biosynthesis
MHIGLLIYGSLDTLTGGYLYDRLMVERWRAMGDRVDVVTLPWRDPWRHLLDNFNPAFRRRLANGPWEVLIQDELNHPSVVWMNRWLRRRVTYPILSLIHLVKASERRPAWQSGVVRWLESSYLRTVDGFIYNSRDSRRLVETMIGPGAPGIVVYPGKDHQPPALPLAAVAARPAPGRPLRLISVGNVTPRKGLDVIVAALAQLPAGACHLTVIGSLAMEPEYVAGVRAQIARAGLADRVELLGVVPNAGVNAHLATSDLFVLPSQYEGFGIVYLEALGAGLPVIASTAGAAGEIIRDGREGYLVPAEDPGALRAVLQRILDQPSSIVTMRQAARARYEMFPTWQAGATAIRAFAAALAPGA